MGQLNQSTAPILHFAAKMTFPRDSPAHSMEAAFEPMNGHGLRHVRYDSSSWIAASVMPRRQQEGGQASCLPSVLSSGSPSMLSSAGASSGRRGLASASGIGSPPSPSPAPAVRLRRAPGFPLPWMRNRGHPRRCEGPPRGLRRGARPRHRAARGAGGDRRRRASCPFQGGGIVPPRRVNWAAEPPLWAASAETARRSRTSR
jgi:hypothetical protein